MFSLVPGAEPAGSSQASITPAMTLADAMKLDWNNQHFDDEESKGAGRHRSPRIPEADGDDVRCSEHDGVGETGDSGHVEDTHRRRGGGMISRCRGLGGIPT